MNKLYKKLSIFIFIIILFPPNNTFSAIDLCANFFLEQTNQNLTDTSFNKIKTERNFTTNRGSDSYDIIFFWWINSQDFRESRNLPTNTTANIDSKFNISSLPLKSALQNLDTNGIYFNGGCGEGVHEIQLIENENFRGKIIGTDLADATKSMKQAENLSQGRLKFLNNKTLEQLDQEGILTRKMPNGAEIITDLYGPATYSPNLDRVIQIYLKHLKVGGKLYITLPTTTWIRMGGTKEPSVRSIATRLRPKSKSAIALTRTQLNLKLYSCA
jgi:hypothetical protein